jgi:sec-independent protein translocase protein TatB
MFDFSVGELVVIGAVALIAIGPKELPGVLRAVGQWTVKIRRMASEFQSQFQEALREAEMADLKKEVDNLNDTAKGMTSDFTSQFEDPLNLKEATKWEPKTDPTKAEETKSDANAEVATAQVIKPADALSETAAVTPDGYAVPEAAPPATSEPHMASDVEPAPPAAPAPADQSPSHSNASVPEGSGGAHS